MSRRMGDRCRIKSAKDTSDQLTEEEMKAALGVQLDEKPKNALVWMMLAIFAAGLIAWALFVSAP